MLTTVAYFSTFSFGGGGAGCLPPRTESKITPAPHPLVYMSGEDNTFIELGRNKFNYIWKNIRPNMC